MNLMFIIEYDGSNFSGYEIQPRKRTIRGEIEFAIQRVTGENVSTNCAGRTDKGVHALAQVVNFHTSSRLTPEKLRSATNANLPEDIYIKDAIKVPDEFHARYSAKVRIYLYRLLKGKSPLWRNYVGEYRFKFNMDLLKEITQVFYGEHNFERFTKRDSGLCNIRRFEVYEEGDEVHFEVEGNRFLHKQVRMMIGTALLFSRGKLNRDTIIRMLNGEEGRTALAPASGLYLKQVIY